MIALQTEKILNFVIGIQYLFYMMYIYCMCSTCVPIIVFNVHRIAILCLNWCIVFTKTNFHLSSCKNMYKLHV